MRGYKGYGTGSSSRGNRGILNVLQVSNTKALVFNYARYTRVY